MSITDAKDPESWQIGFEDGIKFAIKVRASLEMIEECKHWWEPYAYPIHRCKNCYIEKDIKEILNCQA